MEMPRYLPRGRPTSRPMDRGGENSAHNPNDIAMNRPSPFLTLRLTIQTIVVLTTWLIAHSSGTLAAEPEAQPRNVDLTSKAWKAFTAHKYTEALAAADKCIKSFEATANKDQQRVQKSGKTVPTGAVSDAERKEIEANGLLNDVAACFLIKGRSLAALKQMEAARAALESAKRLTHARAWDEQGWFWSPAEAAEEALAELK